MAIDMRKILSGELNELAIAHSFSLTQDEFPFDTQVDGVVFTKPAAVTGKIVNMGGYISLDVTVSVEYDAECARCLKPLSRCFETSFSRTVVNRGDLVNTSEEDADDYIEIVDGMLDLDTVCAEQLMMEFPMKEVCRDDCKGLCPKCGHDLNEGDCGCQRKEIDPRLAILQKLLEK
ncbi:MAG: DUF177 domain-containing protein [Clostridia bacterium]|nr:DUF177 domain-containing protein [Clostridia bacterium]